MARRYDDCLPANRHLIGDTGLDKDVIAELVRSEIPFHRSDADIPGKLADVIADASGPVRSRKLQEARCRDRYGCVIRSKQIESEWQ